MSNLLRLLSLSVVISFSSLYASEASQSDVVEVTASRVEGSKTTLHAKEGVVVYYRDSIIHADEAYYDKSTHLLVLDGNIEMIGYRGTKEHTSHMEIDTQTNAVTFKELFFTNENDVWLLSSDANRSEGNYTFGSSMLSSCDIEDPLWRMYFSRSLYDSEAKYMKIYDAKIYFADIPLFYTPYLAFSTDNQRESGLLFPLFGYGKHDGIIYEQPIFWAINESMDLEFNPQIRTDRSAGIYATYRFADSPYSSGELRLGYFKDKASYTREYNLPEDRHYGLEFLYDASKFFYRQLPEGYRDGLYANITLLNDIDYLNLQKTTLEHFGQVPLQESRVNYFLSSDDWYGGVNLKYFIDTRLEHNDATIQTLPALQLHKYLSTLIWDNLTYSADLQTKRFEREEGPTLNQVEMRVPLAFTASFFDDFLSLTLGESLYYGHFFFGNDATLVHDYFQYHSNIHTAKIFADLTRRYEGFTHVIHPSLYYLVPGTESEKPVGFNEVIKDADGHVRDDLKELFSVGLPEERMTLALSQYFYNDAMQLLFFQRLEQSYYPDRAYRMAELSNEMQYLWRGWTFYNNLRYAYEFGKIAESSSRVSLHTSMYDFGVGHTYKKALAEREQPVTSNDLTFDFRYDYDAHITLNGGLTYNLESSSSKLWRLGGGYREDCWSIVMQLTADVLPRPASASGEQGYTQEYGFTFQLNFIPFASIGSGR